MVQLKAELTSVALSPICSKSAAPLGDILAELLRERNLAVSGSPVMGRSTFVSETSPVRAHGRCQG